MTQSSNQVTPNVHRPFSNVGSAVAHHTIPQADPPEKLVNSAPESLLIASAAAPIATRPMSATAASTTRSATTSTTTSTTASASAASQWQAFARYPSERKAAHCPGAQEDLSCAVHRQEIQRRSPCGDSPNHTDNGKARYLPLSRTTDRVLRLLLDGDLSRLRAESVSETLGISCTTLRRRLRNDHTSYQFLLDRARQYRCESRLRERWLPGKCLADELGYLEVNSFYRAFRRWTGLSYSDYRQLYH